MYVEVADMMEDAICWAHYLADVVRALVRDNPQIETERTDGNVLQEIVDGFMGGLREGDFSSRRPGQDKTSRHGVLPMSKYQAELRWPPIKIDTEGGTTWIGWSQHQQTERGCDG